MKESKTYGERQKIFSCCFNDEQSIRNQGGVPTGVTFSNGVAYFNASAYIDYKLNNPLKGTFSFRIKFKCSSQSNKVLVDLRGSASGLARYISILNATDRIQSATSGIEYINAIATESYTPDVWQECVVTGVDIDTRGSIRIGANYVGSAGMVGYIELFEIYNYTLTAQEVSNLYNNSRYRDVGLNKDEQLGAELVVDGGFDTPASWTCSAPWTINGSKANFDDSVSGIFNPTVAVPVTAGKRYKFIYTISDAVGNASVLITGVTGICFDEYSGYVNRANGTYTEILLCTTTRACYSFGANNGGSGFKLDNLSIKEVICERTRKILDVDASSGIRNKLSGGVYNEILTNPDFSSSVGWTNDAPTEWFIADNCLTGVNATGRLKQLNKLVAGKTYTVRYTVSSYTSGSVRAMLGSLNLGSVTWAGTIIQTGIADAADFQFDGVIAFNGVIDNVSVKEVIPSVVNTATTVQKINDVNAMLFNGTTSKVDCGSYDGLIGDKTFVAWVNLDQKKSDGYHRILINGKVYFTWRLSLNRIEFMSDGGTTANTTDNSISKGKYNLIIVTRTSSGITNIYINGVLSGVANQSSGTPAAGTINIHIGYNTSGSYWAKGLIDKVRIIDGILDVNSISEIFSAEKSKYGL